MHPPGSVLTRRGTLSQVFTPFWRRWSALPLPTFAAPGDVVVAHDTGSGGPLVESPTGEPDRLVSGFINGIKRMPCEFSV